MVFQNVTLSTPFYAIVESRQGRVAIFRVRGDPPSHLNNLSRANIASHCCCKNREIATATTATFTTFRRFAFAVFAAILAIAALHARQLAQNFRSAIAEIAEIAAICADSQDSHILILITFLTYHRIFPSTINYELQASAISDLDGTDAIAASL